MIDLQFFNMGHIPTVLIIPRVPKRKRCGKAKHKGCTDSRPQHKYISKLESRASTLKTRALFLSCLIDAIKKRNVVVANIPGAFLSADWTEGVSDCYIKFEGVMIDKICQINPEYKEYIKFTKKRDIW